MKRTYLKDRVLPSYTHGEEVFNMVTHVVGAGIGAVALILCVLKAFIGGSVTALICSIIFGISVIMLYTVSSIYHGLKPSTAKKVFQVLDHCTIYFLIAGTYTPVLLCSLINVNKLAAYLTLAVVWGLTALAITLNAIDLKKYKAFSMICYLGIGWAIIFSISDVYTSLGTIGFWLLLSGGIAYTAGTIFYKAGPKIKYFHSVFHIFTVVGTILHALMVLLYVI